MIEAIYKFGRMLDNVGNKNPITTSISVVIGGVLPIVFLLIYLMISAPLWLLLTVIAFVICGFLTFTGKKIYSEYKND